MSGHSLHDPGSRPGPLATPQAAAERLALALAASSVGVWEWDPATRAMFWSRESEEILGISEPAPTLDLFKTLVHPDDLDAVFAAADRALAEWTTFRAELRIIRPDNKIRWIATIGRGLYDDAGRPLRLLGTVRDITAEREAAEAVRQSETRLRQVLDALPMLVWIGTPDGRNEFANARWCEYTGLPATTGRGDDWQDHIHPADRSAVLDVWRAAIASGSEAALEYRLRRRDGAYRWFAARSAPLRDGAGAIVRWVGAGTDVDDARSAREGLLAREQQLAKIAAVSPGALHTFRLAADGACSFPYVSPAIEALYGLPADLLMRDASAMFERIHPDDRPALIASIAESARTLSPWRHEWRYDHPVRGELWIEGRSMPVPEPDGAIQWHGVVMDVTEQRRAAAELRRWADAFNHCAHGISMGDPATQRLIVCNAAYARMFGCTVDELAGTPLAARYPASEWPRVRVLLEQADRDGEVHYETTLLRRDGSQFPAEITLVSVRDAAGSIAYRIATVQDITPRHEARQSLRAAKERLDAIVRATPIPIVASDPHGGVVLWNQAAEELFGWTADEVLGGPVPIVPDDRQAEHAELRRRVLDGEPVVPVLTQRTTRDGRRLDVKVSLAALPDEAGQRSGVVAVYVDLTEHLALEAQVRHAAKMESLGQLAGGVAHDFNNWLTVITACTELLSTMHARDGESIELLREIESACERAVSLTRQLLAFSRRDVIEPRLLDLNVVVGETEKMLRRLLGEDIELTTDLADGLSPVRIDAGQWSQILMNLALNARDAMPRGGRLSVETRAVVCGGDEHVRLTVADTGTGMTPEVMARIFEPFFTTKGVGRGTGLGLAVVHGIVSQSGGHIEVQSEPGRGSTFRIFLPCVARPAPPARTSPAYRDLCGRETVLLVEDEASVRRLAARALRGHGYTVLEAADGEDALRLLDRHDGPVDLLLTDVVMPRMSGAELARAVSPRYPALRVIFSSGYTDDAMLRHGILTAEVWFLAKPYTIQALLQKVRGVLGPARC